jgi:hypothetical protein
MAINKDNPTGFRSAFESVGKLMEEAPEGRSKLSDYPITEILMFLGDLQRRCIAYGNDRSDETKPFPVAEETHVLLTKADVRMLWAAERYLMQYDHVRVTSEERDKGRRR